MKLAFIANVRAGAQTPAAAFRLLQLLAEQCEHSDWQALYILGNLFDAWYGDDYRHHAHEDVAAALAAFSRRVPVFVQGGSGDFLLGAAFAERTGVSLLEPVAQIEWCGRSLLLTPGDALGCRDHAYQTWYAERSSPAWQAAFLARAVPERLKQAANGFPLPPPVRADDVAADMEILAKKYASVDAVVYTQNAHADIQNDPIQCSVPCVTVPDWHRAAPVWLELTDQGQWQRQCFRLQ